MPLLETLVIQECFSRASPAIQEGRILLPYLDSLQINDTPCGCCDFLKSIRSPALKDLQLTISSMHWTPETNSKAIADTFDLALSYCSPALRTMFFYMVFNPDGYLSRYTLHGVHYAVAVDTSQSRPAVSLPHNLDMKVSLAVEGLHPRTSMQSFLRPRNYRSVETVFFDFEYHLGFSWDATLLSKLLQRLPNLRFLTVTYGSLSTQFEDGIRAILLHGPSPGSGGSNTATISHQLCLPNLSTLAIYGFSKPGPQADNDFQQLLRALAERSQTHPNSPVKQLLLYHCLVKARALGELRELVSKVYWEGEEVLRGMAWEENF